MPTLHLPWQDDRVICHSQRLIHSFQHWVGTPLLATVEADPAAVAQGLFDAAFVVVSHGIEADPVLNYGNQVALDLWEMEWDQFTQTPSRHTAEPIERADRDRLLRQAQTQGYISDYQGIRISRTGKRFWIQNVVLWDVMDETGDRCGQAATFKQWTYL